MSAETASMTEQEIRDSLHEESIKFSESFNRVAYLLAQTAKLKGFHKSTVSKGELLCLMHQEISECLDFVRKPDLEDDHIPELDGEALELADTIIRAMDYGVRFDLDIAGAIIEKAKYNTTRPYMHGKKL